MKMDDTKAGDDAVALREKIAKAHWESERSQLLAEHDYGPWPPTAGAYGWEEDDAEAICAMRRTAADAILQAVTPMKGEGTP